MTSPRPAGSEKHEPVPCGTLFGKQRRYAGIKGSQSSLLADRESKQVGVGDMLVSEQASSKVGERFGYSNIFGPEVMRRMLKTATQHIQRVSRRNSAP